MSQIRLATPADLPAMLALVAQAQAYFCRAKIDQWQDGYPDEAVLRTDIARGVSYVAESEGHVCATFMAAVEADPCYAAIDGAWHIAAVGDAPDAAAAHCAVPAARYAVLHRVAVEEAAKGGGLAGLAVTFTCALARRLGACCVRADTHADNVSMRRMLVKNGFVLCGRIRLQDGAVRVAYERVL